jgi:DNA (cytosine-5)-methyltransferase 1
MQLVLSLFPGIGLLDMAFEEEGFCVVRGPDVLWGGDVKRFHPPAGKFDGVIGGPPCQSHSPLVHLNRHQGVEPRHPDMTPELAELAQLQGLPADFLAEAPFTIEGKCRVIGNGVPLPMGRAVAKAVQAALTEG